MDNKTHYICTGGCNGVSEVAKECESETCQHKGLPLEPCDCTDSNHGGKQTTD